MFIAMSIYKERIIASCNKLSFIVSTSTVTVNKKIAAINIPFLLMPENEFTFKGEFKALVSVIGVCRNNKRTTGLLMNWRAECYE